MKHAIIIMPTYNERENIEHAIVSVETVVKKISDFRFSILVVDDNSPDGTAEVVRKLAKKYNNIFLLQGEKEGLGAAYVRGMNYAIAKKGADVVVEFDADGQHPADLLPAMFEKIKSGADFVIGSRYIPGGSVPANWGFHRKVYSSVGNLVVRLGFMRLKIRDWTTGYRAIKSEVFKKVGKGLEQYKGYTFQVALLNRAYNARFIIDEVPLKFKDRKYGESKIAPFDYIKNLLLYIFFNSIFIKYLIVGVTGFLIQTVTAQTLINLHISEGLSVSVGAFLAICANFMGNNLWTFGHKRLSGISTMFRKFTHFVGTSIGAVIIQGVVVEVGVRFFGEDAWFFLMIFAIGFFVIPYNYFIYNRFIWKTHEK